MSAYTASKLSLKILPTKYLAMLPTDRDLGPADQSRFDCGQCHRSL